MSILRDGMLLLSLAFAAGAMADGTGPTQPDKARQHPLDNSAPRDDSVEQPRQGPQRDQTPVDEQPGTDVDAAAPRALRS